MVLALLIPHPKGRQADEEYISIETNSERLENGIQSLKEAVCGAFDLRPDQQPTIYSRVAGPNGSSIFAATSYVDAVVWLSSLPAETAAAADDPRFKDGYPTLWPKLPIHMHAHAAEGRDAAPPAPGALSTPGSISNQQSSTTAVGPGSGHITSGQADGAAAAAVSARGHVVVPKRQPFRVALEDACAKLCLTVPAPPDSSGAPFAYVQPGTTVFVSEARGKS